MPNNNDDLQNRLVALEQQLGLTTRNDNHIQANTDTNVSANIWFGDTKSLLSIAH